MKLEEMCKTVRSDILTMVHKAGSGHPGGSLSATELLVGLYFGGILQVDPSNPDWEQYKYAQRYVSLARATEALRRYDGDTTAFTKIKFFEGYENPVIAYINQYIAKN